MSRKQEEHKLLSPQAQTRYKAFQQDSVSFKQESPKRLQNKGEASLRLRDLPSLTIS